MGQCCCRLPNVTLRLCQCSPCCFVEDSQEPKYARYLSTSEEDVERDNIIGEYLELDPVISDCKAGELKIQQWFEELAPKLALTESDIEINRLKCLKYWDTVLTKDMSKLSGSTVSFCFEKKPEEAIPRLVIEHRGKPVFIRNASKRASKNQPTYARPLVQQTSNADNL